MPWIILSLLGVTAFLVFYQDYTTRSVVWPLFLIILVLGVSYSYYYTGSIQKSMINILVNNAFFLAQIALLKVLFGFRKIINQKIGIGDIVFIVCCCSFFSPVYFLVFYILSLVFSLCFYYLFLHRRGHVSIPLAGTQAIFLFIFLVSYFITGSNAAENGNFVFYKL